MEIGWSVTSRDSGVVIADVPFMTYPPGLDNITEVVSVDLGGRYSFQIRDLPGDGLCCEFVGSFNVTFEDIQLVYGFGNFGFEDTMNFTIPESR
jgi:hypothetical protein